MRSLQPFLTSIHFACRRRNQSPALPLGGFFAKDHIGVTQLGFPTRLTACSLHNLGKMTGSRMAQSRSS